jgi:hypothetical protein
MAAEDAGWDELHALMDSLTAEAAEQAGYYPEGWSAKDLLAHIGSWLAEAGVFLLRIRVGTYTPEEVDVDAMNRTFLELMKDVPLQTVRAPSLGSQSQDAPGLGGAPGADPGSCVLDRKGRSRALRGAPAAPSGVGRAATFLSLDHYVRPTSTPSPSRWPCTGPATTHLEVSMRATSK